MDPLPFDRRYLPRRTISGHAMAVFSSHHGAAKISRVELVDASWAGIGIKAQMPIEIGTSCSLTPEDAMWPRQIGIVIRCEKDGEAYRIGLQSRLAKAAA